MKTHILCLGDSNTHGYCADPNDCADHGIRFNEDERWTCRLQKALGDEYLVTEEGLSGRTTVFVDPIHADKMRQHRIRRCWRVEFYIPYVPLTLTLSPKGRGDRSVRNLA